MGLPSLSSESLVSPTSKAVGGLGRSDQIETKIGDQKMTVRQMIKGWHFDPRDTAQQRYILRTNRSAQRVRRDFPAKTVISNTISGMRGVVDRHVPGNAADGGHLVVLWDNGITGKVTLTAQGPNGPAIIKL